MTHLTILQAIIAFPPDMGTCTPQGYYASAYDPGDFAGTILKSPRLCTTTVERCEEKIAKKKLDADRYRAFKNGRIVFY